MALASSEKQKRQAEHIEEGYEKRGTSEREAERRAWATVNKMTGGGKKSGSGRGKKMNKGPAKKGGHKGGMASAARPAKERSASAKKAATAETPGGQKLIYSVQSGSPGVYAGCRRQREFDLHADVRVGLAR